MARDNRVLTIDVGGDNLKMAEFSITPGSGIVLTGFAFRRFDAKNENGDGPTFAQVYNEMLAENRFTARDVRLSLAAQNSFQRLGKLPPMLGNRASISKIVEYEARQTVPYSMNEVEWGYQLIHHQWVENTTETAEDGTVEEVQTERSEYEALFIAMKTEDITPYTDAIEASGRKVLSVEALPDFVLGVRFSGGEEKRYDMKPVFAGWPMFAGLKASPELFANGVEAGGMAHTEARRHGENGQTSERSNGRTDLAHACAQFGGRAG